MFFKNAKRDGLRFLKTGLRFLKTGLRFFYGFENEKSEKKRKKNGLNIFAVFVRQIPFFE